MRAGDRRLRPAARGGGQGATPDTGTNDTWLWRTDDGWTQMDTPTAPSQRNAHGLAFDSKRYVGAQIGIHNPQGEKVGQVARLRNVEYLVVCGEPELVDRATGAKECRSRALSQS